MSDQIIFFPSNLKYLRERKKLTQERLAQSLEITRAKLNALESGQTRSPQPEDYLRISDFFKISIDSLLKVNLPRLGELKLRELEAGNDIYMAGSNIRVLAITVDRNNKENVEYVPIKAKAGYRAGYNDPEYIATLPKFSFPNLPKGKTHRMFPISGDSMLPIPSGSAVIAQFVQDWKGIRENTPCIVILSGEQDFVFKLVTVLPDNMILLKSLNEQYKPYPVEVSEVNEIWEFQSYQSSELPEAGGYQHLLRLMNEMNTEIRDLKKGDSK